MEDLFEDINGILLGSGAIDRPFISEKEFALEKELLTKVFNKFCTQYLIKECQNRGRMTKGDIEEVIKKVKLDFKLTKQQDNCVEGLFDIFFGVMVPTGFFFKAKNHILDKLNSYK